MKPTDSSERIKALMRQHTASMVPAVPPPIPATASRPPPVTAIATAKPPQPPAMQESSNVSWDRITIRLTAGELEKINDIVIATQQANRWGKVTTTDILRVALRRLKDQDAIDGREIKALRVRDGRFTKREIV